MHKLGGLPKTSAFVERPQPEPLPPPRPKRRKARDQGEYLASGEYDLPRDEKPGFNRTIRYGKFGGA